MWQPTGISSNEISHIVKVTTSLSHNVITPLITQILDFAKCSECGFIGKCICNGCDFCDNHIKSYTQNATIEDIYDPDKLISPGKIYIINDW